MIIFITFLGQKVDAADWFLDLQAFLHFTSLDVPEADSLVIRAADQTLAWDTGQDCDAMERSKTAELLPRRRSVVQ